MNRQHKSLLILTIGIVCSLPLALSARSLKPSDKDKALDSSRKDTIVPRKVLIISFFPKMFMSDINRELVEGGKTDIWSVVSYFSTNAAYTLKQQLAPRIYTPEVLEVKINDPKQDNDLKLVDRSVTYKYDPVPAIIPVGRNKKKEPEQLNDNTERYMHAVITSAKLMPYIKEKYAADYIIFLNEFDIRNDYSNPEATISGPSQRLMKLHYTVFKSNGEELCSNRTVVPIPVSEVKAADLVKKFFNPLVKEVAACLPDGSLVKQPVKK